MHMLFMTAKASNGSQWEDKILHHQSVRLNNMNMRVSVDNRLQ